MVELWLVVSTVCFSRVVDNWTLSSLVRRDVCIQQVSFHADAPFTKNGEVAYRVKKLGSSWQDAYEQMRKEELGFIANDYALDIYGKHYGQLETSTQIKILEHISTNAKNSPEIKTHAAKLLWRLRIKLEEDLMVDNSE
jgi:hypothetical protein